MIDTEFYGFDPEQKIHLLRPNYNKNINYDIDLIDHISFYSKVANKLELDGFLEELENELDVYLY
ncbi:MAG: hypothetical protein HUJ68_05150 [Clostridia bacterium]|nr:hypothetical protein [Clostridia bacterium]